MKVRGGEKERKGTMYFSKSKDKIKLEMKKRGYQLLKSMLTTQLQKEGMIYPQ